MDNELYRRKYTLLACLQYRSFINYLENCFDDGKTAGAGTGSELVGYVYLPIDEAQ